MPTLLQRDTDLPFPDQLIVTASAGSGKTRTLTDRLAQFLVSPHVHPRKLPNILAVTFTNNAVREMKKRILELLKLVALGDPGGIARLEGLVDLQPGRLQLEAGTVVETILDYYGDFQIQTIDSFLIQIFRASALEMGLSNDFEIKLDDTSLFHESFDRYILSLDEPALELLGGKAEALEERENAKARYLWDPVQRMRDEVMKIYKQVLHRFTPLAAKDRTPAIRKLTGKLVDEVAALAKDMDRLGLKQKREFEKYREAAKQKDLARLCSLGSFDPLYAADERSLAPNVRREIGRRTERIGLLRQEGIRLRAYQHYQPAATLLLELEDSMKEVRRSSGSIEIGALTRILAHFVRENQAPEIYFNLGEQILHYLIDEFQDTNPLQWETLKPLVENSLGTTGTLFIVGDMKQSIFGFRGADWRIMKQLLEKDEFPSAPRRVLELHENHRSGEKIVRFNERVFKEILPETLSESVTHPSGLATYKQEPSPEQKGRGYVEVSFFDRDSDDGDRPERQKIIEIVRDCIARGFRYRDIALITPNNANVVEVSSWLSKESIPFLSHSGLDIRSRKVVAELLALLRFLDSPVDDLSFSTFILGDLFAAVLGSDNLSIPARELSRFLLHPRGAAGYPGATYTRFRASYPDLWRKYFEQLFKTAGYLPLYDLTSSAIKKFRAFQLMPGEEGALAKLLEVVKRFEDAGENGLREFVRSDEEGEEWKLALPRETDAVPLMTIHKAKGLGFPVTMVLLYDGRDRSTGFEIEEKDGKLHILHITQAERKADEDLAKIYDEGRDRRKVDKLNQLYVGLTRAEVEMYVLSIRTNEKEGTSSLLPREGFGPAAKPPVVQLHRPESRLGETVHHAHEGGFPGAKETVVSRKDVQRGELIHAVLAKIEYWDPETASGLGSTVSELCKAMQVDVNERETVGIIRRFLEDGSVGPLFSRNAEGIPPFREQEFVSESGELFRMDRVILSPGAVTVVDFKTGKMDGEHENQIDGYMRVLRQIYPGRTVRGMLAYLDLNITKTF
ncbi:MAG TPA: UvrD-helicase domain-containing protein [Bacteroidota bacterium]|nr:UvrD-helicase domain-containing protein [Bacteroidota bacterium]